MCGINGAFSRDGKVSRSELVKVRDSMAVRGPDASGEWFSPDGVVGFGHRRLAIIGLSELGNQPMVSPDGRYIICFNGEIYNYRELATTLDPEKHTLRTGTDTEVVLALFAEHGAKCCRMLRGMFAFAIWDSLKKELFVTRDLTGIKPLYYAQNGRDFRFASQVKSLLLCDGIDSAPEAAAHVAFFLYGRCPIEKTMYRGIKALPPGSYITVSESGISEPIHFGRISEYFHTAGGPIEQEELREVLLDSMRAHFVADVPVSLFLSAGRDSATMLALASEVREEPIHAVTLAFDEFKDTPDDESVIAREIAELYGANHTIRSVSRNEFAGDIEAILSSMDQPTVDGVNSFYVSKVTAELGVKVALSGVGADEIFGGYPSFRQVPKLARSAKAMSWIPGMGVGTRRLLTSGLLPKGVSPKTAGLLEYGGSIEGAYMLRRALYMPWEIERILGHDMTLEGIQELDPIGRLRRITANIESAHAKVAALELSNFMIPQLLVDSDWASMAHSLELRTPFVDREVLNAVGSAVAGHTPPTKRDMALTPKIPLPASVMNRPKTGFSVPVRQWIAELNGIDLPSHSLRDWARFIYSRYVPESGVSVNPKDTNRRGGFGQAATL
ncbi:MAG: asparagine synthase (glutamine-hydrolyzing) [Fimbriimonadaceae bacterium]|nr:asparagine synthase (glutamine-hydrolyzing) [Fimbriimonadaceae bacterium]